MTNPIITAYLARAAEKGFHLRPDTATEAMSLAGIKASPKGMTTGGPDDAYQLVWRAMGRVAPVYGPEMIDGLAEIQRRLAEINDKRHDDGTAHHLEKALWYAVLKAIADTCDMPESGWAQEALKSTDIKFERWFA